MHTAHSLALLIVFSFFFFFLLTRRPPRSTLSLHDALPICCVEGDRTGRGRFPVGAGVGQPRAHRLGLRRRRSEEHTSELQSRPHLVCRLLLEKKKHTVFHHLS